MATRQRTKIHRRHGSGMSLLELLAVLLVIGILAAIAYPSYVNQIRKARRTVAKSALLDLSNRQEQYFFAHRAYADAANLLPGYTAYSATILFDKTGTPTTTSADAVYAVDVEAKDDVPKPCGGAPCFKLEAVPQNDQANDACGTFHLRSDNEKEPDPSASNCW